MELQHVPQGFIFKSAKCRQAIPFVTHLLECRLIQLSLDGGVEAIDRVEVRVGFPLGIDVRLVAAYRGGIGHVQLIGRREHEGFASPLREAVAAQGFEIEPVDPCGIIAEPRYGGARAVWALRGSRVATRMRLTLLAAVAEHGPLQLSELCSLVPGPDDPIGAVAAMACAGDLQLDLSTGFGHGTIVRSAS